MKKLKLLFATFALILGWSSASAETDYTGLMPSAWTGSGGDFQGGRERYQGANYTAGQKVMYQSFTAPATGIYEIKFYAVTSSTSGRGFDNKWGPNIAQAYATAGENKATVAMEVINQTGCTLVQDANIRTLSVEATKDETIEYGLENIGLGGNWYTIKALSAKMKTVAEIFQAQYDEAYAIWEHSTENEVGARATFKTYVDALNTAMSGTLADAQEASDNLAAQLVIYESKSYPVKGSGVKYDFTSKMSMAINAWTCNQGNGPAQYGFTGATETYGNTSAGKVMYQTLTGLANGEYEIHFYAVANAANGGGVGGTKTTVYANDQENEIDVITQNSCTPSDYERTFTVMVTDGSIEYGFKNTVAAGNWYICKNVALYMTGAPDLSDYYEAIAGKLTTANGLKSSPMKSTVLSALQDAIDATEGYSDITVIGTLETMSDNLTTAINNANTSVSNYEDALSVLNAASNLDAAGQASYAANETVAAIQSAYNDRSLESVSSAQQTACATALSTAAKAQTTEGANMTLAIANPSFETNNFTGWTNTGNMATQGNDSFTLKDGTYYAEFWQPNETKRVSQEITGLQSGVYRLSVASFVRGITSAKIYAGDVEKGITVGADAATYSVEFACDNNANVTIGFEAVCTGAASSWICVDNFRLTLVSSGLPDVEAVTGKMNATVAAAQTTAVETYEANRTVANYNAAVAAIAAAQASKDAYASGKAALDKAKDIMDNTNVYTAAAYETFNSSWTAGMEKYNAETWTTEEANGYKNMTCGTGWHSTASVDDFLISAWDVDPRDWSTYHVNTWSTTGDSGNPNMYTPCIEYWTGDNSTLANKVMTATISGKNPGDTYKVAAKVCLGVNTGVDASTAPTGISLQLNDGEIISCSGTRTAETRFYEGDFEASGIVGMDGNLYVKLNVASTNVSWMTFRNVKYTLTSAAPAATDEQKTALADAITAAESKTLGFKNGEYAPYNNVEALEALATAKAIDPATATGYAVVTATTALTGATWTANNSEVNAIFDGNFAHDYSGIEGNVQPIGWHGVGDKDNATNVRYMHDTSANPGLAATFNGTAMFAKFTAQYGTEVGYTMPLKAGAYSLNFIYGGWNENGTREIRIYNATNNATISPSTVTAPDNQAHTTPGSWRTYNGVFVVPADGDYVLSFYRESVNAQNQIVISDISIYSVPTQSKSISSAGYATFCSPYALDFSGVSGLKAYIVKGTVGETTELNIEEVTSVPANTGVLLEGAEGNYDIPVVASADAVSGNKLVGVIDSQVLTAEAGYVLMGSPKVGFYKNNNNFTLTANTAYLPADFAGGETTARSAYFFRGEITGVANVEAAAEAVQKDGKFFKNGKLVIFKNGKKFNAAGQIVK